MNSRINGNAARTDAGAIDRIVPNTGTASTASSVHWTSRAALRKLAAFLPSIKVLILSLVSFVCWTRPAESAADWKAGIAREVITPQKPLWMAGYAGRTEPAVEKEHDLMLRVLALEDSTGARGVIVATDTLGIPKPMYEQICAALSSQHGLHRSQIMLNASHTHCGPVLSGSLQDAYSMSDQQRQETDEYSKWLTDKIVAAVGTALKSMKPASVFRGMGMTDFAVNRRTNREPDVPALREQNQLYGPVDHTLPVLSVQNLDGSLQAVVFIYACHNTTLSYQKWCGDYAGFAQYTLEGRYPGSVAMFCMGCGADQNPLPRRTVELCEQYGKKLANAVDAVLNGGMIPVSAKLEMRHAFVPLIMEAPPAKERLERIAAEPASYSQRWAKRLLSDLQKGVVPPQEYDYPVQAWRLGGKQLWITLGGEVVVDYSLRLKAELGEQTWVSSYANDVMAYIPSKRVLLEGGYEGQSSMMVYGMPTERWAPDIEDRVVKSVMKVVNSLDQP